MLQTYTQGKISTGDIIKVYKGSRKTSPFKDWSDEDAKIVIERVTKIEEFKNKIKERAEESCLFSINISVLDKLFHYCKLQKKMNNDSIPEKMKKKFETEGFQLSDTATIRKERDDEWAITNGEWTYIVKKEDGKIKIYEDFEKKQKTSRYNPKVYRECNRKKGKSKYSYKESPKGKIIIFIDDLDRIPEEKIVDFLDSLKIFLDISGCIFVLGCDYEILKNALRKKHGEEEIYKDYFDKIVQTDFYVPKISEQAIKRYLQFLTGWDAKEIEECTQLVIHSIGGNPRKIKRVVNATMLIKSVFEKKLGTFLEAFERPKPAKMIELMGDEKKEKLEEPFTSESKSIRLYITPTEVFDFLFDKKILFKLMCMREQWPAYYEAILSEEKKQNDLISLQEKYILADIQEYSGLFSTAKEQKELEESVKKLSHFLKEPPIFQGVERDQQVVSVKTYLTFLEISSPEAGIALKWGKPEKLPLTLFNRYMLFEGINKGKVEVKDIENRINQEDWTSDLKSYFFFIEVLSRLGYNNQLRGLFRDNGKRNQIAAKLRASEDLSTIGRLLFYVRKIEEDAAKKLLDKTWETYAEKIIACSDLHSIGMLLFAVREIKEETARELLSQTKDTIAENIRASTDPGAIGELLDRVRLIKEETARELVNETSYTYAEKINASTSPELIKSLLDSISKIDKKTAEWLEKETEFKSEEK